MNSCFFSQCSHCAHIVLTDPLPVTSLGHTITPSLSQERLVPVTSVVVSRRSRRLLPDADDQISRVMPWLLGGTAVASPMRFGHSNASPGPAARRRVSPGPHLQRLGSGSPGRPGGNVKAQGPRSPRSLRITVRAQGLVDGASLGFGKTARSPKKS